MKSYSLGLAGQRVGVISEARNSVEMLFAGLEKEFAQLGHVKLHILPIAATMTKDPDIFFKALPEVDFLLVHFYSSAPVVKNIRQARGKVKHQICSIIELIQKDMDYCFAFLRRSNPQCYIPFPYSKEYMGNLPKVSKTILIDAMQSDRWRMTEKFIAWLRPLAAEGYTIYQLTPDKTIADFIIPIPECGYQKYMEASATMETFIPSHPESYGHSIIDMVGRGIRVFVPINQPEYRLRSTFLAKEMIEDLDLPTFSCAKELYDLMKTPIDTTAWDARINRMTEYREVVSIIDRHFQSVLS